MSKEFRETDGEGRVLHLRFGQSIACKTRGSNQQATTKLRDVNCRKCLSIVAKIQAVR